MVAKLQVNLILGGAVAQANFTRHFMKRPSFQFYPADWLSDPNVIAMTAEERGAYIQLIALMWNTEDCSLKDDVSFLARLAGVDNNVITQLYHCFNSVNGVIRHKRLDLERAKQDSHRSKRSEAGQKGMMNRWGGVRDNSGRKKESRFNQDGNLIPNLKKNEPEKMANTSHSYNSVITKDNSSSSSSSSSSNLNTKEKVQKESTGRFAPPSLDEVKAYFLVKQTPVDPEQFHAFYQSKGWKVGASPMKDWKAALVTWEKRLKTDSSPPPSASRKIYKIEDKEVSLQEYNAFRIRNNLPPVQ